MKSSRATQLLIFLPAAVILGIFFIYPLLDALLASLSVDGKFGIGRYLALWNDPREKQTIITTFKLSVPVSLFSVMLATFLSYRARVEFKGRYFFQFVLILPMTLGTVLISIGLLNYMGPTGWLNSFASLVGIASSDSPLRLVYNSTGVIIGLFLLHFPLTFLLIQGHMQGIDPQLDRAANLMGAGRLRIFFEIILPLSMPAILTSLSLHFVAAFAVFPTAVLLGQPSGETRVMTLAAYEAAYEYSDYPKGATIALTLALIQIVVTLVMIALGRIQKPVVPAGKS